MVKQECSKQPINLNTVNQTIKDCLGNVSALSNKLSNVDQINIIVELLNLDITIMAMINCRSGETCLQHVKRHADTTVSLVANQINYYNKISPKPNFNDNPAPFYQNEYCTYHLPLYCDANLRSAIEFINTSNQDFNATDIINFSQIAGLIENIFKGFSIIQDLRQENIALHKAHLEDHILVDITNIIVSNHDLGTLIQLLSRAIIDFFALDYIGFILPSDNKPDLTSFYSIYNTIKPQVKTTCTPSKQDVLLNRLFALNEPTLFDIDSLYQAHADIDYLANWQEHCLTVLFCIPLAFNNREKGLLLLAHKNNQLFTNENIKLFQHIADRIIVAINNIQVYKDINALNNSLTNQNLYLTEEIKSIDMFKEIIGSSPAIRRVFEQVEMVAKSNSSVLLLGETGTGKELFARAIHQYSLRNDKRMIKINCSAVPANLLESELFGHEKGAFTGATAQRIGRFELAQGSTLLLDEIGDIPLELQPKLLRVLQEKEIERLGSNKSITVDVRVISATNCDLAQMISDKRFRADLFYRLNVFPIIIPPLREREGDIPLLVQFFIEKFSRQIKRNINSIASQSLKLMCDYHWPGNIRELANVIERAVIINKGQTLHINRSFLSFDDKYESSNLAKTISGDNTPQFSQPMNASHDDQLRQQIIKILKETNGVVAGPRGAANRLNIKRTTLLSRMQRLGISAKDICLEE
ncbi:sigma 54-interacting transcriptional regulator [Orbus sturtevantii]